MDKVGGFECKCPPGFVGPRCEGDINECLANPCSDIGTYDCVQMVNNYICNCKLGYVGRHCEMKVNFCEREACQNGGVCTALESGHTCFCREGFSGRNCEFFGYGCNSNPCLHDGKCKMDVGGRYTCQCPEGEKRNFVNPFFQVLIYSVISFLLMLVSYFIYNGLVRSLTN